MMNMFKLESTDLGVERSEKVIGEGSLLGGHATCGEEVSLMFMEKVQCIDIAEDLQLFFHALSRYFLLQFLDESAEKTEIVHAWLTKNKLDGRPDKQRPLFILF